MMNHPLIIFGICFGVWAGATPDHDSIDMPGYFMTYFGRVNLFLINFICGNFAIVFMMHELFWGKLPWYQVLFIPTLIILVLGFVLKWIRPLGLIASMSPISGNIAAFFIANITVHSFTTPILHW